jgi:paraquat-inducible protein A
LCHGVLALGLVAPCMTIVAQMGDVTDVADAAGLLPPPKSYSVLTGILALFEHGNAIIGVLLLAFSVLFPVTKLVVVRLTLQGAAGGAPRQGLLKATALFSKYSMVDVFVIALIVVASKTLPGGSRIDLEWGTLAFATAALLSMVLTSAVGKAVG